MRETVRSMRAYFVVIGALTAASHGALLLRSTSLVVLAFGALGLTLALAYLGLRLLLTAIFALRVVDLLSGLVGLLIIWYLYVNARRLAAEARVAQPPQPQS
ncbi:MAG TPA: hypothetical protein VLX30_12135 [Burkholderiales bacterium]|nr:hypothetical protein [Burkholderiales bacterium]